MNLSLENQIKSFQVDKSKKNSFLVSKILIKRIKI